MSDMPISDYEQESIRKHKPDGAYEEVVVSDGVATGAASGAGDAAGVSVEAGEDGVSVVEVELPLLAPDDL